MSAAAWFWESLTRPFVSPDRTLRVISGSSGDRVERHAVFVPSWSLAENLPRRLLRVAAPAHRLEVRSIKE